MAGLFPVKRVRIAGHDGAPADAEIGLTPDRLTEDFGGLIPVVESVIIFKRSLFNAVVRADVVTGVETWFLVVSLEIVAVEISFGGEVGSDAVEFRVLFKSAYE